MFSRGNLFFVDQCVQDRQLQPSALKHKIFKLQVHYEVYVVFFFCILFKGDTQLQPSVEH